MDPRMRTLLSWQLRFSPRRRSTWLFGGAYVALTFGLIAVWPGSPVLAAGRVPFRVLQSVHAAVAVIAAIVLAGQSIDDRASGTLGFLKIANIHPRTWVQFRFLAAVAAFLPIWVLRLPVYVLVFSLGGVTLHEFLWLEAVQWVAFLFVLGLSLLNARFSTTEAALGLATIGWLCLSQAVAYLPLIVLRLIGVVSGRPFLTWKFPWADSISELALARWFWTFPASPAGWGLAVAALAIHLGLASVLLRLLTRTVFFNADTTVVEPERAPTKAEEQSQTRPSRRVSDDPLAWQVCHVHTGFTEEGRITAVVFASALVLLLTFGVAEETVPRSLLIGVSCGLALVMLAFKPSDCLSREVSGKTLGTMALLPWDGQEIYEAWLRGSRELARPAYAAVAAGCVVMTILVPENAVYFLMVMVFAFVVLPDAAFLSNVVAGRSSLFTINLRQLLTHLWIGFLALLAIGISLVVALVFQPWLGPATLIGLSFFIRSLIRKELVGRMAERIEREQ